MMQEMYLEEEKLHQAFNAFDLVTSDMTNKEQNKSGEINLEELKVAFGQDTNDIDEKDLMAVLKEADLNNDGNIDIDDFFKMMYGENEDSVAIQE